MSSSIHYRVTILLGLAWCLTATAQDYADPIHRTGMENSICPNGSREDSEQCDDNNGTVGDGCAANCRFINCGDAQLDSPYEDCDDGDNDSADGCDGRFCFVEMGWHCDGIPSMCAPSCGDGAIIGGEQCDDQNLASGDGCSAGCLIEPGYQCAGTPSVCVQTCGNSVIEGGETCDDGNLNDSDGCSVSCQVEPNFTCVGLPSRCGFNEAEPNEDGAVVAGASGISGNDFGPPTVSNATTNNGVHTLSDGPMLRYLQINPMGDEDVFVIENTDPFTRVVRVDTWNAAPGTGVGVPCTLIDTGLNVRQENVVPDNGLAIATIANNDDRNGSLDRCSGLNFEIPTGQRYYLHVLEFGDNSPITTGVLLELSSIRKPCSNGVIETGLGEQCDDGGVQAGDGCSATCQIEANHICRQVPSLCYYTTGEPNDDGVPNTGGFGLGNDFGPPTLANAVANSGPVIELDSTRTARRAANIAPAGDEDVFAIHNGYSADQLVRIETWIDAPDQGEGHACIGSDYNQLNVRADAGNGGLAPGVLQFGRARSNGSGDNCSMTNVVVPANSTVYAQVLHGVDSNVFGPYLLTVQNEENHCSDGVPLGLEQCDDAGLADGDGCSATCLEEPGYQCAGTPSICQNCTGLTEAEPNNTTVSATTVLAPPALTCDASLLPMGDIDFYRLQIPARASIRLETNDSDLLGRCLELNIDTEMALIAPDGTTELGTDDDDGPGTCSLLEAPGDAGLVGLAAGTYFVRINEFSNDATVAAYRLQATFISLCSNGQVEPTESCDDANLNNGDGCDSQCAIEPGFQCGGSPSFCGISEAEPNDDGSVSTGGADFLGNDAGSPSIANSLASLGIKNLSTAPHTINGNLIPAGDEDIVAITNDTGLPQNVRVDIWRNQPGFGEGVPCGGIFDTMLRIADAQAGGLSGTTIAQNDDRAGSADRCSGVAFVMLPGETKYAQLITFHDDRELGGYRMSISSAGSVCGNFLIQAGEQCDDGNASNGDFCSASCQLSNDASESEPNNSHNDVIGNDNFAQADYLLNGSINPVGDNDWVGLRVQGANTVVRLETLSALTNCDARTTSLGLYNFAGASLIQDVISGIGSCSAITVPLPDTNDYFFRVGEQGDNLTIPNYLLEVQFHTETLPETEPNDALATANTNLVSPLNHLAVPGDHSVAIDVDWYRIEVPAGGTVRAEIVEFDRNVETCESNGIDSRLTLYNSSGTVLVSDDDDGRGFCSKIDGKDGDTAARNNSPSDQTWYLRVDAASGATTNGEQFAYRLVYSVR